LQSVFERTLESGIHTNGAAFRLSSMTTFLWDRVFVFHPYMPAEAVDKSLGFTWHSTLKRELEYSDGFELLVFVRGDQVVKTAKIRRKVIDWDLGEHNGLKPGEDVFVVERPTGSLERVLRLRE
jgi:hypothetical protein